MWHELRVILHNRENALVTKAISAFAREEQAFADQVAGNWTVLIQDVEDMPYE
jgi:sorting nexin-8